MGKQKVKILSVVPYQKCPVCEGSGQVFNSLLDPYNTTMTTGYITCRVCSGSGIIPMHVVNDYTNVLSN